MAKNKKPKKKYIPRVIYFPKIINSKLAFEPLELGLEDLLKNGRILQDDFGTYIYRNSVGEEESFVAGLEIYSEVAERIVKHCGLNTINTKPLIALKEEMEQQNGFEEDTIENAFKALTECKTVISNAPTLLVRKITEEIGLERKNKRELNLPES